MEQFFEYVKMALDNIMANKGRSFLTMLGIIIGITSVVTIVSIGNGLKADVLDAANDQNNTFTIQINPEETTDTELVKTEDLSFLKDTLADSISSIYVSAYSNSNCKVSTRKGSYDCAPVLTTQDYENAQYTSPVILGKYFTENDVLSGMPVCVIDELTALYLFGNTDVIGMNFEMALNNSIQYLTIVGVRETSEEFLEAEKQYLAMGMDESISIEMPYTLSQVFGEPIDGFSSLSITVKDQEHAARISQLAVNILNSRHQSQGDNLFMKQRSIDLTDMFGPIMDGVTAFVALVAAISLVVGGIGVMNIMLHHHTILVRIRNYYRSGRDHRYSAWCRTDRTDHGIGNRRNQSLSLPSGCDCGDTVFLQCGHYFWNLSGQKSSGPKSHRSIAENVTYLLQFLPHLV